MDVRPWLPELMTVTLCLSFSSTMISVEVTEEVLRERARGVDGPESPSGPESDIEVGDDEWSLQQ